MTQDLTKKELTHQRMLDAANKSFKEKGYAGIGVDGIAQAAGVTSGAFYSHFGSKDNAFQVALKKGLDQVIEGIPDFQNTHGEKWVEAFVDYYLGKDHRNNLACGCALTTLTPEVARFGAKQQVIYEERSLKIISLISMGLKGTSQKEKDARAWSMIAILIGGLNMMRALNDDKLIESLSKEIKSSAITMAGDTIDINDIT